MKKKPFTNVAFVRSDGRLPVRSVPQVCVAAILLVVGALSGCAPRGSGTHVELSSEDGAGIEKVGLYVNVKRGFAVRLQYVSNADQLFIGSLILGVGSGLQGSLRATGGVVGDATLLGTGFGAGVAILGEFSPDKRATRALNPEAVKMKSAEAIGRVLVDRLKAAGIFSEVELLSSPPSDAAQENSRDALFVFTVKRWGLRPPLGSEYGTGDKRAAQLELDGNLRLVSCTTGKVLWERDELYLDGQCYTLGDFKSQAGLLAGRMELALQKMCAWTTNEIHRVRQNQQVMR